MPDLKTTGSPTSEANEDRPDAVPEAVAQAIPGELDNEGTLLTRQHNACLPISSLPAELLIAIFHYTLPSAEDGVPMPRAPSIRRLISVCHAWREAALGTPELWTLVSSQDSFNHVEQALQLSNPMPLDVVYHCDRSTKPDLTSFFKAVSQTSSRWRRLDITHDGSIDDLQWMEEVSVPILENFYLKFVLDEDDWDFQQPRNLFKGSPLPKLRTITLSGVPLLWELGQLAGGGLRHLELCEIVSHAPSVPQILDIIRLSPLLTTLSLNVVALEAGDSAVLPTLQPQALAEFRLREVTSDAVRQLVLCVRPPQCRIFAVDNTFMQEDIGDFFSPGLESVVPTILRDRQEKRIYINFTSFSTMLSNGSESHIQINGYGAVSGLEWVRRCLESQTPETDGEVHVEVSDLKYLSSGDVPRALQTIRDIPNVVELTLHSNTDDWEHGASLLNSLASLHPESSPGGHGWPFPRMQHVALEGGHSLIPAFIQVLRTRRGLDSMGPRVLPQSYPPPIKVVHVRPANDELASFSRSELDELQDIVGAGGGNLYWRSKLWKDWPEDQPYDQPEPVCV
ncbi:hypothetical protein FS837_005665 [Tulasnella sp. UAMH 9824]|nr:hypothetical protein FS837_005665 [Tulasnella sp. UAMH 9824]